MMYDKRKMNLYDFEVWTVFTERSGAIIWKQAIRNAAEQMNYCPICKRLVCNTCFLICDDLDMCAQCASDLEQQGFPVMAGYIESN